MPQKILGILKYECNSPIEALETLSVSISLSLYRTFYLCLSHRYLSLSLSRTVGALLCCVRTVRHGEPHPRRGHGRGVPAHGARSQLTRRHCRANRARGTRGCRVCYSKAFKSKHLIGTQLYFKKYSYSATLAPLPPLQRDHHELTCSHFHVSRCASRWKRSAKRSSRCCDE